MVSHTPSHHIVLVGLMGTGKSTVGRLVAQRLERPFLDSDDEIEARTGRSVREIWQSDGEPAFRALETDALTAAIERDDLVVVAAAGGVVLAEANRQLLVSADADVVWLRARPETLVARIAAAGDSHRPLLDGDPAGMLETMAEQRGALYSDVSGHIVDVDDLGPADAAAAVIERVTPGTTRMGSDTVRDSESGDGQ